MSAWDRARKALSFETREAAKKRKEECLDDQPTKKRKTHTGSFDNICWDGGALKEEVISYGDNHNVNWSELARRYEVRNRDGQLAKNGGQIIKEWLISENVDVRRFVTRNCESNTPVIRCRKRKAHGGEISVPVDVGQNELRKQLQEKLLSKEFTIGDMIVPRQVMFTLKNNSHIVLSSAILLVFRSLQFQY